MLISLQKVVLISQKIEIDVQTVYVNFHKNQLCQYENNFKISVSFKSHEYVFIAETDLKYHISNL